MGGSEKGTERNIKEKNKEKMSTMKTGQYDEDNEEEDNYGTEEREK